MLHSFCLRGEVLQRDLGGLEAGMGIRFNVVAKQGRVDSCSLRGGIANANYSLG